MKRLIATTKASSALLTLPLAFLLAGCNTATKAVDNTSVQAETTEQALSEDTVETASNIKHEKSKVSKAGTNIVALVNGEVVSSYDVQRRAAFLKLRRVPGNRTAKAKEELIEQTLKMQEAKRLRVTAGDAQVEEAFKGFAKGNRMTPSQLGQVLARAGVTKGHFKEFVRGQISWNNTVGASFRSSTQVKTTNDTMNELRKKGEQKPETNEYLLQQVIFVLPKSKRKAGMKQRKNEAEAFRKTFQSCETTSQLAVGQRDVTIRQLPRILEPQLPPEWSKQVIATPLGATTGILETDKGVEFLAICTKKTVSDDTAAATVIRVKEFSGFNNETGTKLAAELLAKLKKNSTIIYR